MVKDTFVDPATPQVCSDVCPCAKLAEPAEKKSEGKGDRFEKVKMSGKFLMVTAVSS